MITGKDKSIYEEISKAMGENKDLLGHDAIILKNIDEAVMYKDMFDASSEDRKWLAWELKQTELKLKIADSKVKQLSALLRDQA